MLRSRASRATTDSLTFIKNRNDLRFSKNPVLILIDAAVFDNLKDHFVSQRFGSPGLHHPSGIHTCPTMGKFQFDDTIGFEQPDKLFPDGLDIFCQPSCRFVHSVLLGFDGLFHIFECIQNFKKAGKEIECVL